MKNITKVSLVAVISCIACSSAYSAFIRSYETETIYYSDATKTEMVGGLLFACHRSQPYTFGQRTDFKTVERSPC